MLLLHSLASTQDIQQQNNLNIIIIFLFGSFFVFSIFFMLTKKDPWEREKANDKEVEQKKETLPYLSLGVKKKEELD